jgi:dipeptidyl-peptidase-4
MLVDLLKLSSGKELSEAEKMQRERQRIGDLKGIVSYDWASDSKAVLVPLDGDLFLAGLDGSVRRIPGTQGGELNPRWGRRAIASPCARSPAVGRRGSGAGRAGGRDAGGKRRDRSLGRGGIRRAGRNVALAGFWWSPDESRLAVERFDEARWAWSPARRSARMAPRPSTSAIRRPARERRCFAVDHGAGWQRPRGGGPWCGRSGR